MAHAKFDDLYDDKRKIKRAWRAHPPNPVGLHAMAVTWCIRHQSGGYVEDEWLVEMLPNAREREAVLRTLVEADLFTPAPHRSGSYRIQGFHHFRPFYRPPIPGRIKRAVLKRDAGICQICGGAVEPQDIDLDHRYPLSHGGPTTVDNLQVTHSNCNRRKGARI